jgi:hypothetical protein
VPGKLPSKEDRILEEDRSGLVEEPEEALCGHVVLIRGPFSHQVLREIRGIGGTPAAGRLGGWILTRGRS